MEINIIAKGESLKSYILEGIPQPRVGINDAIYQVVCDYCCFWDTPRWFMGFAGEVWTIEPQRKAVNDLIAQGKLERAKFWKNKGTLLDIGNQTVPNINLSGILAISCAILKGFNRINLWGYDGGGGVFFDSKLIKPNPNYERYNGKYQNLITPGVEIINMVNPEMPSKIDCFERCNIPENIMRG